MTKIAILGKTGMLGSELEMFFLQNGFEVAGITRRELDAENCQVFDIAKVLDGCEYAVNCIGIIKPYIHDDESKEVQRAIEVNALFPHKLAKASQSTGTKVIQIATDCVYDGVKGKYTEEDKHNALDVYGKTKSIGEISADNFLNVRCSIIGKEQKNYFSLLEWFLNQPENAQVKGFKNHLWNGVTTHTFAKICRGMIEAQAFKSGLVHVVPADIVTKAQMLHIFADVFNRKDITIEDIDAPVGIDRTLATIHADWNNELWKNAGYQIIPTVEDMIKEIK